MHQREGSWPGDLLYHGYLYAIFCLNSPCLAMVVLWTKTKWNRPVDSWNMLKYDWYIFDYQIYTNNNFTFNTIIHLKIDKSSSNHHEPSNKITTLKIIKKSQIRNLISITSFIILYHQQKVSKNTKNIIKSQAGGALPFGSPPFPAPPPPLPSPALASSPPRASPPLSPVAAPGACGARRRRRGGCGKPWQLLWSNNIKIKSADPRLDMNNYKLLWWLIS